MTKRCSSTRVTPSKGLRNNNNFFKKLFRVVLGTPQGSLTYVELGKVGEDLREAVMVVLLGKLHLSHIKVPDTVDLVVFVYHCGRLPLRFG